MDTELEMLREFYDCWVAFHKMANSNMPRRQKELAAQRLTDAHHSIEAFRKPVKLELVSG